MFLPVVPELVHYVDRGLVRIGRIPIEEEVTVLIRKAPSFVLAEKDKAFEPVCMWNT